MSTDPTVALITLAQAKAHLKITGSGEDAILEPMINRSGAVCAGYVGRRLTEGAFTEYYDGNGKSKMQLRQFPVDEIDSIHVDPLRAYGAATEVDAADIILDAEAGIVTLAAGALFVPGPQSVKVVYTAGYADDAVPYDLQQASLLILQHHYKRQYQDQRIGITSETVGDRTFNYSDDAIPKTAQLILDSYKELARVS